MKWFQDQPLLERIVAHCQAQQRRQGQANAMVTYRMQTRKRNETRRNFLSSTGPSGRVLSVGADGYSIVAWHADELVAFVLPRLARLVEAKKSRNTP